MNRHITLLSLLAACALASCSGGGGGAPPDTVNDPFDARPALFLGAWELETLSTISGSPDAAILLASATIAYEADPDTGTLSVGMRHPEWGLVDASLFFLWAFNANFEPRCAGYRIESPTTAFVGWDVCEDPQNEGWIDHRIELVGDRLRVTATWFWKDLTGTFAPQDGEFLTVYRRL